MPSIQDIRQKYPQYHDMSDQQLADALHAKYYSDIPKNDFYQKIGISNNAEAAQTNPSLLGNLKDALKNYYQGEYNFGAGALHALNNLGQSVYQQGVDKPVDFLFGTHLTAQDRAAQAANNQAFNQKYGNSIGAQAGNVAGNVIPFAVAPEVMGLNLAPELLGSRLLGAVTSNAAYGAGANAITGGNPLEGADIGAVTVPAVAGAVGAAKGIGTLFGTKNAQNAIGNAVLSHLNKASAQGAALSPQEAAENLATNYTGANGQPLNVDIGTVANNPLLKGVYQGLKYVPFSGVSKNINILNKGLSDKAMTGAQDTASALVDQLSTLNQQQKPAAQAVENAPVYFNQLASGINNRANITQELKSNVADIFDKNRQASNANYAPINNSNLRFDNNKNSNLFPNYASATKQLLANRENMNNLFDKDSDLSASLRNEIDKAQGVINNSHTYGITLPEAVSRIQNLGQLQASANSQGRRYEGMLLGQLKEGLSADVTHNLVNSGNGELAKQLQIANDYHKNNVIPFYQNNSIRKAVTSNYIPTKASLASALHDPNSQSILMQLPNEAQNASLYQLLTGGKGSSSGLSHMDAKAIGNAYAKLPVDAKTAIAKYNPQADQYFERLPSYFQQNQAMEAAKQPLHQQLSTLQSTLQGLKKQRFGNTPEKGAAAEKAAKVAEGLGALAVGHFISPYAATALPVGSLLGRTTAKALSNPALIHAYITGGRLPVTINPLTSALMRTSPALTMPYFNQQGGQ